MSESMCLDSGEGGWMPEDMITIEESSPPAKTLVIFDQKVSIDRLQSHRFSHRLIIAL